MATTTVTRLEEDARIRAVVDGWADAIRTKDADRVIAHYADGSVHFTLAPPLIAPTGDADGLRAWFGTWQGPIGYEVRDLAVTVGGDVAFCHSLNRMSGTKTDVAGTEAGELEGLWFRMTLGLRKIDGRWKIVHEHESVPFYMDGSFKAAIDLEP